MSYIICLNKKRKTQNYGKFEALVSKEDFHIINQFSWSIDSTGYAHRRDKNRRKIYMHRLIMDDPKSLVVDHINGNHLDNRRENLRVCSHENNMKNRKKEYKGSSIYKGVTWNKVNKNWMASIVINKVRKHVGSFKKERHAAMARDIWEKEVYGEFSQLNFKPCLTS